MPLPPIPYLGPKRSPFWPNPRPTIPYLQGDVPVEALSAWGYEPDSPINKISNIGIKIDYNTEYFAVNNINVVIWDEATSPNNKILIADKYDNNQPLSDVIVNNITSWDEVNSTKINTRIRNNSVNGEPLTTSKKAWNENQDFKFNTRIRNNSVNGEPFPLPRPIFWGYEIQSPNTSIKLNQKISFNGEPLTASKKAWNENQEFKFNTRIKNNSINGEPLTASKKAWNENQDFKFNTRIRNNSINGEPLPFARPVFWGYEIQSPNTRIKLNQKITFNGEPFVVINNAITSWYDDSIVIIRPKISFDYSNNQPLPTFTNPFIKQYWLESSGGDDYSDYEQFQVFAMQELEIKYDDIHNLFIPKTDKKKRIEKNRARIARIKKMSKIKKILSGGASAIILYKTIKKVIE